MISTLPKTPEDETKLRCFICHKKIGLMAFTCKCSETKIFCLKHRFPESHNCEFDHKKLQQSIIEAKNPEIKHQKLEKI